MGRRDKKFVAGEEMYSPSGFLKQRPEMGPFFKVKLAESWGCPGMLRMPSGFKA